MFQFIAKVLFDEIRMYEVINKAALCLSPVKLFMPNNRIVRNTKETVYNLTAQLCKTCLRTVTVSVYVMTVSKLLCI